MVYKIGQARIFSSSQHTESRSRSRREMSAFGGDSWAREAGHRKRRVDDLIVDGLSKKKNNNNGGGDSDSNETSSYKKLSNGKYACTICPKTPIFDTSLMLSIHIKGSRHIAAESRFKEKELMQQEELRKRIALSGGSVGTSGFGTSSHQIEKLKNKPLIEWTRKITSDILKNQRPEQDARNKHHSVENREATAFISPIPSSIPTQRMDSAVGLIPGPFDYNKNNEWATEAARTMLVEHQMELRERREKELKFTAAGWKRDGHGGWFRDENVEFDSDEEDPNVCLA